MCFSRATPRCFRSFDRFEGKHRVALRPRPPDESARQARSAPLPTAGKAAKKERRRPRPREGRSGAASGASCEEACEEGDWRCCGCAQGNFARRQSCFTCGAPKPASKSASPEAAKREEARAKGEAAPEVYASFSGFVGDSSEAALASAASWRSSVLARLALAEAKSGGVAAWAARAQASAPTLRAAVSSAVALAEDCAQPPPPPPPPLTASADGCGQALVAPAPPPRSPAPALYERVLRLLRAADASGQWPASSTTRARIIEAADAAPGAGAGGGEGAAAAVGSFALGSMPPPLEPPKANEVFFDLMEAAFELEAALSGEGMPCSGRPPSSTIAVNRNARFKPHTDSGSGAGQSLSLIVALGDFDGGGLCVEGSPHDVRYRPLQFSGWTQRHWTLPFAGERFSLVWFTPRGCEGSPGLRLCAGMRRRAAGAATESGVEAERRGPSPTGGGCGSGSSGVGECTREAALPSAGPSAGPSAAGSVPNLRASLSAACRTGDVAAVEALLEALLTLGDLKSDLNGCDGEGKCALFHAASKGHVAVVRLLLGPSLALHVAVDLASPRTGATALVGAAGSGHAAVVELLLDDGRADPAAVGFRGRGALHGAARFGHADAARLLVDDPRLGCPGMHAADETGRTPLVDAAGKGHIAVLRVFAEAARRGGGGGLVGEAASWFGHAAAVAEEAGHGKAAAELRAAISDS